MRRAWSAVVGRCALPALLVAAGCAGDESTDANFDPIDEYLLGGQTGSLIPDCDVSPLSSSGRAVPAGDALAVLYSEDCPEAVAAGQLVVTGPDGRPVTLSLQPLFGEEDAYLVRSDQSLAGGRYELSLQGQSQELTVDAEGSMLPERAGELRFVPGEQVCGEMLEFELELTPEALAYAPLTRWFVSVDGGREQLWVDYGALELSAAESPAAARLELPRCGLRGCLEVGSHWLSLRGDVADQPVASEGSEVSFDVECDEMPFVASDVSTPGEGATPFGCGIGAPVSRPAPAAWRPGLFGFLLAGAAGRISRTRRRR